MNINNKKSSRNLKTKWWSSSSSQWRVVRVRNVTCHMSPIQTIYGLVPLLTPQMLRRIPHIFYLRCWRIQIRVLAYDVKAVKKNGFGESNMLSGVVFENTILYAPQYYFRTSVFSWTARRAQRAQSWSSPRSSAGGARAWAWNRTRPTHPPQRRARAPRHPHVNFKKNIDVFKI